MESEAHKNLIIAAEVLNILFAILYFSKGLELNLWQVTLFDMCMVEKYYSVAVVMLTPL